MELKSSTTRARATATLPAPQTLFGRDYNEALVHQIVIAYQATGRRSTRAQEGPQRGAPLRASKPWRQKGTGRARGDMTSSPLRRGGGKAVFPEFA